MTEEDGGEEQVLTPTDRAKCHPSFSCPSILHGQFRSGSGELPSQTHGTMWSRQVKTAPAQLIPDCAQTSPERGPLRESDQALTGGGG